MFQTKFGNDEEQVVGVRDCRNNFIVREEKKSIKQRQMNCVMKIPLMMNKWQSIKQITET
jgi:hypothetical protein